VDVVSLLQADIGNIKIKATSKMKNTGKEIDLFNFFSP